MFLHKLFFTNFKIVKKYVSIFPKYFMICYKTAEDCNLNNNHHITGIFSNLNLCYIQITNNMIMYMIGCCYLNSIRAFNYR